MKPISPLPLVGLLPSMVAALLIASCGGGTSSSTIPDTPAPPGNDPPPTLAPTGAAIIKFRAMNNEWAALVEKLRAIEDLTAPDRRLLMARNNNSSPIEIDPLSGWSLIDFALHPSGEISMLLATDSQLRLQRRDSDGALLNDAEFTDPLAATDPFVGDLSAIRDSQSLVPKSTRDAARLTAIAEDVLLVFRSGRNAVIEQRFSYFVGAGFVRQWRTLVEPGVPIDPVRLTSGTFDPFASLDGQWHVTLDVDAQGRSAVAVSLGHTELPNGHRTYFGEPIDPGLVSGAIVTILDANGTRLGATPVDTQVSSEVHAVHWSGDTVLVAGRMLTTRKSDGTGWDGFLARVKNGDSPQLQVLDFDRGDVILDIATLPDGHILLGGSSAYVQNPQGASISEGAEPLLAILPATGNTAQRLSLPAGPRQTQVRTVAAWRDRWLIGGLQNGPGTHSADGDPSLLVCDGFLREQVLP